MVCFSFFQIILTMERVNYGLRKKDFIPLPRSFYEPTAKIVAQRLLGHFLIRNTSYGPCGGAIVETEAYLTGDPASHGFPGQTARNRVMFGEPGHAYVYFIYGCHFCVNAVCRPPGISEAVLIRALEPAVGEEILRRRRHVHHRGELTNGPAKLCQAMSVDRRLNGVDFCNANSPLFIARNPDVKSFRAMHGPTASGPRIGITRAATLPLRFYLEKSSFVSKRGAARMASAS
jgi:DNA-3-methyladenine glycosylase